MSAHGELERLAAACIFPGFPGLEAPFWVREWLEHGLGGVVLFARNVESREQLRLLTSSLHAARDGVLVATDEEGGDVTRLEAADGSSYPGNAALGAVDDVELTVRVAAEIAAELAEAGVDLDLAPVADVNTNPLNPVIGIRSFGAEGELVARHVAAFVRGLQDAGVAACAKHFPGHGDTSEDSHLALPTVDALTDDALLPFRAAIAEGVQAIMTAHVAVHALGEEPATTSRELLDGLLRHELGYPGMVMTDALEMRAISATLGVEEGAVRALAAGADALCLGHDLGEQSVYAVRDALVAAVRSGRLPEPRLAEAAGRVRGVAEWVAGRDAGGPSDRASGLEAARRALEVSGDVTLSRPALVVELEPEPSIPAGRSRASPAARLRSLLPQAELVRAEQLPNALPDDGRQLVVVARDAHRHAWEREAVEALLQRWGDAIVVEVGLPYWRPRGAPGFVATYGAARVNIEAAAERLRSPRT
jgi:beta-N-acetylhexosaminidase